MLPQEGRRRGRKRKQILAGRHRGADFVGYGRCGNLCETIIRSSPASSSLAQVEPLSPDLSLQFTGQIRCGHHTMVIPRSGSSISKRDKLSVLKAMLVHGHGRVMKEKRIILNKYFTKPKTGKEVEKILRFYQLYASEYNPYRLGGDQGIGFTSMSSHALSKWHHVLPEQDPNVASGMAAALEQISEVAGFSSESGNVLKFLSSLMKTGERQESLDSSSALILTRLLIDLEEEVTAAKDSSHPLFVHMSQSFWKFLKEKADTSMSGDEEEQRVLQQAVKQVTAPVTSISRQHHWIHFNCLCDGSSWSGSTRSLPSPFDWRTSCLVRMWLLKDLGLG
jgi:hypothetical protein